jgi:S1-C subfamily serine protease
MAVRKGPGSGRGLFGAVRAFLALLALLLLPRVARAEIAYSGLDGATVRVFVYRQVELQKLRGKSGKVYVLGVPEAGHGSGLLVTKDGLILTARHVVEDAEVVAVQFPGEEHAVPAEVAYVDKERDHAFLVVEGTRTAFVEFPKRGPKLAVREPVYVVGYPLDASRTSAQSQQGIVSGVLPDGSLQLGVALNPGNSGGPVVDAKERLIGIAVARADPAAGAQGIGIAVPVEQMLPSYEKMSKPGELAGARKVLATQRSRRRALADVLGTLLTTDELSKIQEALEGDEKVPAESPKLREKIDAATKVSGDANADMLVLSAAQLWNSAAVSTERKVSADSALSAARSAVEQAKRLDPEIAKRSEFAAFVLEGHSPTDAGSAASDQSGAGAGGAGSPLQVLMDSLETRKALPVIRIGPTFGLTAPFQLLGIGISAKLLIANRLNLDLRYQFGWHAGGSERIKTSHLLEGLAGVAVGNWNGTTTARLVVDVERDAFATVYRYVPGEIPTVHSLVVEAGVISGPINYQPPVAPGGTPVDTMKQVMIVEGGVRYTYFYYADSEYLSNAARSTVELTAHLMLPPFGMEDGSTNVDGDPIRKLPGFKTQVGWGSAPLSWGLSEIGLGYFPGSKWFYARFGWTYLFY